MYGIRIIVATPALLLKSVQSKGKRNLARFTEDQWREYKLEITLFAGPFEDSI
jgi:hypothetical protein